MQKIQSYLYPNRSILLADLAGFTVENTIVYAKTVKIYKGVDNVIEFDIQNADQKRLDLTTTPVITDLALNVTDEAGNALPNSPYAITALATKGLASAVIPSADLTDIAPQFFRYTVTATKGTNTIPLYTDSRFSAVGTIELVASAMPTAKPARVYKDFSGEINFMGNVINHSPVIATKFYEAVPTSEIDIDIDVTAFIGTIYVEATRDMTISVESFKDAPKLVSTTYSVATTTTIPFHNLPVNDYNYFRVSWVYPDVWQFGSQSAAPYGTVDKVTVNP